MKTTVDLPGELVREIKLRALRDGRKLKDAVTELLRRGLAAKAAENVEGAARKKKVKLPLIKCRHAAEAATEMTPERIANLLLKQEASWHETRR